MYLQLLTLASLCELRIRCMLAHLVRLGDLANFAELAHVEQLELTVCQLVSARV